MTDGNELPRPIKLKALMEEPYQVVATETERAALARRFGLEDISSLSASVSLTPDGEAIQADGVLTAKWMQLCAVSGDELPVSRNEGLSFRFTPADRRDLTPGVEVELEASDCDEVEYHGDSVDLGEAVAQSFGLVIDPYAVGENANDARRQKNIVVDGEQQGQMAELLAGLKTN